MPVRPRAQRPIYAGTRMFLGRRDLVVSFYTKKCQFQCTYCALPQRSAPEDVSASDLNIQVDGLFQRFEEEIPRFQQFSFGNEGSALDEKRFHLASLRRLLERVGDMASLEVLSIETRVEYVSRSRLEDIRSRTLVPKLDITVGFETQDDQIRQGVLRKNTSRRVMEDRIRLAADLGVRLTSYVMIKPAPWMTERDGIREAIATMEYLGEQCERSGVELVIYLTPMYVAEGSHLQLVSKPGAWVPPTIQSIYEVVIAGHAMGLPVYTGLWSEGMAGEGGDYRGRDGYDPVLRSALARFNRSADFTELETSFLPQREWTAQLRPARRGLAAP